MFEADFKTPKKIILFQTLSPATFEKNMVKNDPYSRLRVVLTCLNRLSQRRD